MMDGLRFNALTHEQMFVRGEILEYQQEFIRGVCQDTKSGRDLIRLFYERTAPYPGVDRRLEKEKQKIKNSSNESLLEDARKYVNIPLKFHDRLCSRNLREIKLEELCEILNPNGIPFDLQQIRTIWDTIQEELQGRQLEFSTIIGERGSTERGEIITLKEEQRKRLEKYQLFIILIYKKARAERRDPGDVFYQKIPDCSHPLEQDEIRKIESCSNKELLCRLKFYKNYPAIVYEVLHRLDLRDGLIRYDQLRLIVDKKGSFFDLRKVRQMFEAIKAEYDRRSRGWLLEEAKRLVIRHDRSSTRDPSGRQRSWTL